MVLEYDSNTTFEMLSPVLEDYANWFGDISTFVAYPEKLDANWSVLLPSSFTEWLENLSDDSGISEIVLENVTKLHDDMVRIGSVLVARVKEGGKPSFEDYIEFKNIYTTFLSYLRRLEKDPAIDGRGLDEETGLRNKKVIEADLKKEMERLSRQGNPFSLVVARIDQFSVLPDPKQAVFLSSVNVKRCMRSFDDAYYLGGGMFLLSLKHADFIGAQAAVERLQVYLKEDADNVDNLVTMSYSVTEAVAGDEILDVLKNMQQDLHDNPDETDTILKLLEISPLERFVNSTK